MTEFVSSQANEGVVIEVETSFEGNDRIIPIAIDGTKTRSATISRCLSLRPVITTLGHVTVANQDLQGALIDHIAGNDGIPISDRLN